jgi:hypothetical protein
MKKNIKKFVLELPGPNSSYCRCRNACSKLEIDHVMPKKILRQKIKNKRLIEAFNDPHNLYKCCLIKNRRKSCSILTFENSNNVSDGLMARSLLYMNDKYSLKFNLKTVSVWEKISIKCPPEYFEIERSSIIQTKFKISNSFIKSFRD